MIDVAIADTWQEFLTQGLLSQRDLVRNANVEVDRVNVGGEAMPLTVNRRGESECSWVASLRNAYGPYARAETDIVRMSDWLRPLYLAGSLAAEQLLVAGGLAGGAFLNNWLLATNLYDRQFTAERIMAVVPELCRRNPTLPVVIRSLTPPLHGVLLRELVDAGFLLLPSRQVWIVDDPASGKWRRHRDSRRDLHLAETSAADWTWVPGNQFTSADYEQALRLYQRLYRKRYPKFNPDYALQFLRTGIGVGWLDVHGVRPSSGGALAGFVGMVHRGGQSCTPLLGYDVDRPSELGLYRLLMLKAFCTCETRRSVFHCSAGAGLFKFNRGARSYVEFAAIWANHLPIYRRANLALVSRAVSRCVVPYLETHRC